VPNAYAKEALIKPVAIPSAAKAARLAALADGLKAAPFKAGGLIRASLTLHRCLNQSFPNAAWLILEG